MRTKEYKSAGIDLGKIKNFIAIPLPPPTPTDYELPVKTIPVHAKATTSEKAKYGR